MNSEEEKKIYPTWEEVKNTDLTEGWEVPHIFPEPIWRGHFPCDLTAFQEKTRDFLKHSDKLNTSNERDGGASSSADPDMPHTWDESSDFYAWLSYPSEEIWKEWGYPSYPPRSLGQSWANFHPPGAWTSDHTHNGIQQVAILYLQVPEDSGNLQVMNPLFYHWEGTPKGNRSGWMDIPVKTGDVFILPGWMLHRSGVNNSTEDRMTINTNIVASTPQDGYVATDLVPAHQKRPTIPM